MGFAAAEGESMKDVIRLGAGFGDAWPSRGWTIAPMGRTGASRTGLDWLKRGEYAGRVCHTWSAGDRDRHSEYQRRVRRLSPLPTEAPHAEDLVLPSKQGGVTPNSKLRPAGLPIARRKRNRLPFCLGTFRRDGAPTGSLTVAGWTIADLVCTAAPNSTKGNKRSEAMPLPTASIGWVAGGAGGSATVERRTASRRGDAAGGSFGKKRGRKSRFCWSGWPRK